MEQWSQLGSYYCMNICVEFQGISNDKRTKEIIFY